MSSPTPPPTPGATGKHLHYEWSAPEPPRLVELDGPDAARIAELDTTGQEPSGGPEPVRDLGALATQLLEKRAQLTAALVSVVVGVGSLFVLAGIGSAESLTSWAAAVGVALTSVGALLAILVPILGAKSAGRIVHGQAEIVRGEVVPVSEVAAYSPADPNLDVALGPAASVLDAVDLEQP